MIEQLMWVKSIRMNAGGSRKRTRRKIERNVPLMTKLEAESLQTPATSGRNKGGKIFWNMYCHKLWAGFSLKKGILEILHHIFKKRFRFHFWAEKEISRADVVNSLLYYFSLVRRFCTEGKYKGWMQKNCFTTCNGCCADVHKNCPRWAKEGSVILSFCNTFICHHMFTITNVQDL